MAVLLAVLATVSIGIAEFVAAGATKRTRSNEVTASMFASGVILTVILALAWPGDPSNRDLVFGFLAGLANGTAILLIYAAYSRGSLRSAAPAAAVVMSAVPVIWDVVVAGSQPSTLTWTGIVLGVVAIGLTSYQPGNPDEDRLSLPIAIAAGVVFGALLIFLGEIEDGAGGSPMLVQRVVGFTIAAAVARATGPRIFPADRSDRRTSLAVGLFATAALVLIILALQVGGSLAVVSVISSQYAAVAVLLGVVLRGQRMWWWQTVGLVAASVAVAAITIG